MRILNGNRRCIYITTIVDENQSLGKPEKADCQSALPNVPVEDLWFYIKKEVLLCLHGETAVVFCYGHF